MERRRLGSTGPHVSAVGIGCLSFSDYYGAHEAIEAADARRLVERAIALDVTLFDTAAMYGRSEELLGRAIKGLRQGLVIATKFGVLVDERGRPLGTDASPGAVRQACDEGLRRLGIDVIDLFYLHRLDKAVAIEETVGAMAELVRAGKVRHLGLCEVSARTLRRAHKVHPIAALQSEYSLWSRDVEREILPACRELGIGFVAYSPLGRGFLTGAVTGADSLPADDARRAIPRFQGDNLARNVALLDDLRAIAARHGATSAQVALAWLLAQGPDIVPIPGTKRPTYLAENAAAVRLRLSAEEIESLGRAFAPDRIAGERYGETARAFVDD
jgi:aryl-alcohol dehydrogenase-like predicted oxidoreductase